MENFTGKLTVAFLFCRVYIIIQRHILDYLLSILNPFGFVLVCVDRLHLNVLERSIFPLAFIVKDKGSLTRVNYPILYSLAHLHSFL